MATRFFDRDNRTYAYLESGKLVLTAAAPAHFEQSGRLDLSGNLDLCELPEGLRVDRGYSSRLSSINQVARAPGCTIAVSGQLHRNHGPAGRPDVRYASTCAELAFDRSRTICRWSTGSMCRIAGNSLICPRVCA